MNAAPLPGLELPTHPLALDTTTGYVRSSANPP